jgi:hypothetical protein
LAEELVNNIIQTVSSCPSELRNLLFYMSRRLTERFDKERLRVMTVFLFSRVFIPPLLNPTPFNIIKEPWTPEAGRTGILLAKVIGNLSSGVQFEEHNPLQAFNEFLNAYREKVEHFMEDLIAPAAEADVAPEQPAMTPELAANSFKCIHYFLYWSKDAIVAYRNQESVKSTVSPSVARMFFDLLGIVEDIELAEGKPDPIEMSMLDFENPSTNHSSGKRSPTKLVPKPTALPRPRPERASSAAPPLLNNQDKAVSSGGPQMVRRISEKWNRQLQLDAVRQKQEREAAEKRAQNRSVHQSKVASHVVTSSTNTGSSDAPARVDSDPSLTASTDSSTEKEPREHNKRTSSSKPVAGASASAPATPAAKVPKRKLAPSLTTIGSPSKKGARATVSFGSDSPVAGADDDSSSESRDSSSPSRKPKSSKSTNSSKSASAPSEKVSLTPLSPGRAAPAAPTAKPAPNNPAPKIVSPRPETGQPAPTSPRVERIPSDTSLNVEAVAPSEKNIESLSAVVRNLGVENAQLSKHNKELAGKVDQLQLEVSRLQHQLADAHSNDAKLRSYIVRLGQAMKSRKQTDIRVRQAQTKSKYSMYHSFDDSQFDFAKASSAERREWVSQVVGRKSSYSFQASQPDSVSRRLSTTTSLLKSLPQLIEVHREDASEDLPSSSRSHATPRETQPEVTLKNTDQGPAVESGDAPSAESALAPAIESSTVAVDSPPKVDDVEEESDANSKDSRKHKDKDKKSSKDKTQKRSTSEKTGSKDDKPKDDKPKDDKPSPEMSGRRSRSESKRNASLRKAKLKTVDLSDDTNL